MDTFVLLLHLPFGLAFYVSYYWEGYMQPIFSSTVQVSWPILGFDDRYLSCIFHQIYPYIWARNAQEAW